jgi:colicin import membrane protein
MSELTVIEIKPEHAPAIYVENGLDKYLEQIRKSVNEVPDLSTAKGRARIASLSASVSRSKTAIEKPGRDLLKKIKEQPKIIEAELRRFIAECDALRDEVRLPLTEWEAEQERIAAEKQMQIWHLEALELNEAFDKERAERFEADHEIALLMNEKFDRDAADAKAEVERQRIAHEEELKRQAVEQAQREADEKIQREREASAKREADLKAQAEQEKRDREDADRKAEQDRVDAAAKAEREKQEAIAAEQLKAKQKEDARLADEKRIADEAAARAANIQHQKAINNQVIAILTKAGISTDCAKECVIAIVKNQNSAAASGLSVPVQINY